jgi:hypothetical protein
MHKSIDKFNEMIEKLIVSLGYLLFFKKELNLSNQILRKPAVLLFVWLAEIMLVC